MKSLKLSLNKVFPYLLVIGGAWGIVASMILSYDTYEVAKNVGFTPSCNLNPVLSCGAVINTAGDTIFKVPYPYYGLIAFGVLLTTGVVLLAGAKLKRWYWLLFQAAVTFGLAGSYFLLAKSTYKIHALCPYCLSVDVVVTTIFWYLTLYNIDNKHLKLKNPTAKRIYTFIRAHHIDILIIWFLLITGLVLKHFWYYYGKHL